MGREVAEVDALGRLAAVEVHDPGPVVGADGPDAHRAAVGQDDVGVPLGRVAGRDGHLAGGRQRRPPRPRLAAPGVRGQPRTRPAAAASATGALASTPRRHRRTRRSGGGARVKRTTPSVIAVGLVPPLVVACAQPADEDTVRSAPAPTGEHALARPVVLRRPRRLSPTQAVEDVTAYWRADLSRGLRRRVRAVAGFYPYGPDTEPPPCGARRPLRGDRRQRLLLPGRRHHRLGRGQPPPRAQRGVRGVHRGHRHRPRVRPRHPGPGRSPSTARSTWSAGRLLRRARGPARVAAGDSQPLRPRRHRPRPTVAGMIAIRDQPGTEPDDPFAHGSGFDRIAAFQDGYENGAQQLRGRTPTRRRPRAPPRSRSTERPSSRRAATSRWRTVPRPRRRGAAHPARGDLNKFYDRLFDELGSEFVAGRRPGAGRPGRPTRSSAAAGRCRAPTSTVVAVYCEDENVVVLDRRGARRGPQREIGDFAVASRGGPPVGAGRADPARCGRRRPGRAAGRLPDRACGPSRLPADDGGQRTSESGELTMSAGDLDEGIQGFIAYGGGRRGPDGVRPHRRAAHRVLRRLPRCEEYGPLG